MKSNLKPGIYVGFAVAILLVLMVGAIAYETFTRQSREADRVKHSYKVINELVDMQNLLINMETGRRGFRSTNERKFLEPFQTAVAKFEPTLSSIYQLVQDDPIQVARLNKAENAMRSLMFYWRSLGEDASGYTREIIITIVEEEKKRMDVVRADLNDMVLVEGALLKTRDETNRRSVDLAVYELVFGILFIVLIVGVLIYFILKEFKRRIRAEAQLNNNNEELIDVYNSTAEKNWLLAGMADVNNSLHGLSETRDICEKVLSQIINYTKANAGAIYLFDEEKEVLILQSALALRLDVKKSYGLNEGFVGRAAVQTEPLVIENIPAKSLVIEGGTIQVEMVQAIYAPLCLNDGLKGVIELLTFGTFNERHLELLKLVDNNVAVAINSAQAREEVMQLLEKVQQQKEEMENQQEELRQTNEELSMQAEVLQSSEEELRVQEEELKQINAELEEKNEAVEIARQTLLIKTKELENNSKFKSEFLANMSHELRTPLNSVLILAKLLADNNTNNLTEKQISHAKIIHKSGSDLLQLINDILDLSKIEAGKVDVNLEEVRLADVAADVQQLFAVMAEEKGIHFSVIISGGTEEIIQTDKQKIAQIIKNLLSNAMKFTPPGGHIDLRFSSNSSAAPGMLDLSVTDTGIGISAAKQQLIFEAFQQADGSTSRKYGGTGLGLSITKELVRLLGGKITLTSEENKGSTFTITLPIIIEQPIKVPAGNIAEDKMPADTEQVEEQQVIADDRANLQAGDSVMLIIEDDQVFATVMRDLAREKGYKSIVAIRGDEGLHYAKKYRPTAIILDMKLPAIEGSRLLQLLKKSKDLKHIPVHIVSALDEASVDSSAALAFLRKPVKAHDLENAFTIIGEYLQSSVKRVMLLSGENLKDQVLQQLLDQRHFDVKCDLAVSMEQGLKMISSQNYDCIIADIGNNVDAGLNHLRQLRNKLEIKKTPLIIYLDKDISASDEMELKKVSDVIVRKSFSSNSRLMDELELFLYKVQENTNMPLARRVEKAPLQTKDLKAKNVLVVDDDMRNVFALTAALEQEEMNILTAGDGNEALEALKAHGEVDIVLMDIMMPEMDGYDAMRSIRNDLKLTKLPIIALTAKAMTGDKEKCIQAGASDYITKPVDIHKLVSLMRVWLS